MGYSLEKISRHRNFNLPLLSDILCVLFQLWISYVYFNQYFSTFKNFIQLGKIMFICFDKNSKSLKLPFVYLHSNFLGTCLCVYMLVSYDG